MCDAEGPEEELQPLTLHLVPEKPQASHSAKQENVELMHSHEFIVFIKHQAYFGIVLGSKGIVKDLWTVSSP